MNRPSPLCPPALPLTFKPPSTPLLLASRDCESLAYIHACQRSPPPNRMFAVARRQRIPGRNHSHCSSACFACFLMKKKKPPSFSARLLLLSFSLPFTVWIHLLCCHLLRKSLRWEMRQSHSAVLLLPNLFFSLIQAHSNFFTLHTPTHQSACLLQLGLLMQSHAHLSHVSVLPQYCCRFCCRILFFFF